MSLTDEVEDGLRELLAPELFGASALVVDGVSITGLFAPDERDQAGTLPGQVVERYRLFCPREDLTASVGEELTINGQVWAVVQNRSMGTLTDLTLLRYTA